MKIQRSLSSATAHTEHQEASRIETQVASEEFTAAPRISSGRLLAATISFPTLPPLPKAPPLPPLPEVPPSIELPRPPTLALPELPDSASPVAVSRRRAEGNALLQAGRQAVTAHLHEAATGLSTFYEAGNEIIEAGKTIAPYLVALGTTVAAAASGPVAIVGMVALAYEVCRSINSQNNSLVELGQSLIQITRSVPKAFSGLKTLIKGVFNASQGLVSIMKGLSLITVDSLQAQSLPRIKLHLERLGRALQHAGRAIAWAFNIAANNAVAHASQRTEGSASWALETSYREMMQLTLLATETLRQMWMEAFSTPNSIVAPSQAGLQA